MGEAIKVPDRKGIVIPVAVIGLLLTAVGLLITVLGLMAGVLYQAGQIVSNQRNQEILYRAGLNELKQELTGVREYKQATDKVAERLASLDDEVTELTRTVDSGQASLSATLTSQTTSLRDDLHEQRTDFMLLKDYTEGRISHLPYRAPAASADPNT